jgi:hypothetical protein
VGHCAQQSKNCLSQMWIPSTSSWYYCVAQQTPAAGIDATPVSAAPLLLLGRVVLSVGTSLALIKEFYGTSISREPYVCHQPLGQSPGT